MKRWIGIAFAGALLLAGGWFVWRSAREGVSVEVAVVRRGLVRTWVEERAKTRLPRIHIATMPLDGRILPIELSAGDLVAEGDIVARMETSELETAVAKARANVERLEAEIVQNDDDRLERSALAQFDEFLKSMRNTVVAAGAQIEASTAQLEVAEKQLRRVRKLAEGTGAATESQLDDKQLEREKSSVALRKDELTLASLKSIHSAMRIGREAIEQYIAKKKLQRDVLEKQLAEAEVTLKAALRDRERATIRASSGGVVLKRHVSNRQVLSAGTKLLEIGQLDRLQVEAEILTQDAVDIRAGQTVEIAGPAIGARPVAGRVARIHPQGFTSVSSLGVEQQRVLVVIDFEPGALSELARNGRELGVDYRVRVRVFTGESQDALRIPRSALFRGPDGGWQTFVAADGRARRADLRLGLMNDAEAEVLEGLKPGDQVILVPDANLSPGDEVTPRVDEGEERTATREH